MPELGERRFPETACEALALLYMQFQNLDGKSPSDLYDMYEAAYAEISMRARKEQNKVEYF